MAVRTKFWILPKPCNYHLDCPTYQMPKEVKCFFKDMYIKITDIGSHKELYLGQMHSSKSLRKRLMTAWKTSSNS